jgi:hypothetical protein
MSVCWRGVKRVTFSWLPPVVLQCILGLFNNALSSPLSNTFRNVAACIEVAAGLRHVVLVWKWPHLLYCLNKPVSTTK